MKQLLDVKPIGFVVRNNHPGQPVRYYAGNGQWDAHIEQAGVFATRRDAEVSNPDIHAEVLPVWTRPSEYGEQALQIRFSNAQIAALKTGFGGINRVNPDGEVWKALREFIAHMHRDLLAQLANADVKWLSTIARVELGSRQPIN